MLLLGILSSQGKISPQEPLCRPASGLMRPLTGAETGLFLFGTVAMCFYLPTLDPCMCSLGNVNIRLWNVLEAFHPSNHESCYIDDATLCIRHQGCLVT